MKEHNLVDKNGTQVRISYSVKWGEWLVRFTFKDGGMHLMFIKEIEAELVMLKEDGYIEVPTYPLPPFTQS